MVICVVWQRLTDKPKQEPVIANRLFLQIIIRIICLWLTAWLRCHGRLWYMFTVKKAINARMNRHFLTIPETFWMLNLRSQECMDGFGFMSGLAGLRRMIFHFWWSWKSSNVMSYLMEFFEHFHELTSKTWPSFVSFCHITRFKQGWRCILEISWSQSVHCHEKTCKFILEYLHPL